MKALTAWLPYVLIPGAPQIMAIDAIRSALQEFCRETLVWNYTQDAITAYIGEAEYAYEILEETQVVQPLRGWFNGSPIEVKTPAELDAIYRGSNWMTATGGPRYLVALSRDCARLVPIPDEKVVAGLVLQVALEPADDATEVDDVLFTRHREAIAHGAKARLKSMTDKPFFDAKGATFEAGKFADKIATEKINFWRGHGSSNLTARNPFGKFA
jgi:hypothetical protein